MHTLQSTPTQIACIYSLHCIHALHNSPAGPDRSCWGSTACPANSSAVKSVTAYDSLWQSSRSRLIRISITDRCRAQEPMIVYGSRSLIDVGHKRATKA
eukprot:1136205-Pelagomonas_calceolata.AAC.7